MEEYDTGPDKESPEEINFWLAAAICVPLGALAAKFVLLPLFIAIFKPILIKLGIL